MILERRNVANLLERKDNTSFLLWPGVEIEHHRLFLLFSPALQHHHGSVQFIIRTLAAACQRRNGIVWKKALNLIIFRCVSLISLVTFLLSAQSWTSPSKTLAQLPPSLRFFVVSKVWQPSSYLSPSQSPSLTSLSLSSSLCTATRCHESRQFWSRLYHKFLRQGNYDKSLYIATRCHENRQICSRWTNRGTNFQIGLVPQSRLHGECWLLSSLFDIVPYTSLIGKSLFPSEN